MPDFPEARRGRPPKYPWDRWMDGQPHYPKQGVDFNIKVTSFQALVHRTAKSDRFGGRVETRILDGDTVAFRFIPSE